MCYDDQAQPPVPPRRSVPASGRDLVLTAQDGTQFAAYAARPDNVPNAHVIIYPDVRGLHQFYKDLALRFAEVGIGAIAIDYFGRTAGLTARDESFEFMPHVQQITYDSFTLDVQAAREFIHQSFGANMAIFVVGFCLGGALTLLTGANAGLGFRGLVPFYAGLSRPIGGHGTALDRAREVVYPVLGHFGGADQGIPLDLVQQLDQQLDAASVAHEIVVYPDAPHSFFDRRATQFAEASAAAWQRTLAFIEQHSA